MENATKTLLVFNKVKSCANSNYFMNNIDVDKKLVDSKTKLCPKKHEFSYPLYYA